MQSKEVPLLGFGSFFFWLINLLWYKGRSRFSIWPWIKIMLHRIYSNNPKQWSSTGSVSFHTTTKKNEKKQLLTASNNVNVYNYTAFASSEYHLLLHLHFVLPELLVIQVSWRRMSVNFIENTRNYHSKLSCAQGNVPKSVVCMCVWSIFWEENEHEWIHTDGIIQELGDLTLDFGNRNILLYRRLQRGVGAII